MYICEQFNGVVGHNTFSYIFAVNICKLTQLFVVLLVQVSSNSTCSKNRHGNERIQHLLNCKVTVTQTLHCHVLVDNMQPCITRCNNLTVGQKIGRCVRLPNILKTTERICMTFGRLQRRLVTKTSAKSIFNRHCGDPFPAVCATKIHQPALITDDASDWPLNRLWRSTVDS